MATSARSWSFGAVQWKLLKSPACGVGSGWGWGLPDHLLVSAVENTFSHGPVGRHSLGGSLHPVCQKILMSIDTPLVIVSRHGAGVDPVG